ncbi:hypothetical protein B9Z19DRAFT_606589 [Tuber borchii]|uniref:Uncharacterized protein n=1 Tax=Tuber borchii TaxID=42251 RepID=A0A2T7A193_TUBBO|nr:hypothetical protein B9Z19DRAFT_606589 [Tuber borchii]
MRQFNSLRASTPNGRYCLPKSHTLARTSQIPNIRERGTFSSQGKKKNAARARSRKRAERKGKKPVLRGGTAKILVKLLPKLCSSTMSGRKWRIHATVQISMVRARDEGRLWCKLLENFPAPVDNFTKAVSLSIYCLTTTFFRGSNILAMVG